MEMPVDEFEIYWKALQRIEAEERHKMLKIISFPHMGKEKDRLKFENDLIKKAYDLKPRAISLSEIGKVMNGRNY